VTIEDIKSAASIGGFLVAVGGIVAGWIVFRAVVTFKLDSMRDSIAKLTDQHARLQESQSEFEREVRTTYVTAASIADFRAAMDRGFAAVTERIDKILHK
jgi:hypothetical protein